MGRDNHVPSTVFVLSFLSSIPSPRRCTPSLTGTFCPVAASGQIDFLPPHAVVIRILVEGFSVRHWRQFTEDTRGSRSNPTGSGLGVNWLYTAWGGHPLLSRLLVVPSPRDKTSTPVNVDLVFIIIDRLTLCWSVIICPLLSGLLQRQGPKT